MKRFLNSSDLLQTIAAEAQKNSDTARRLTADLTEAQLNWKPAPEQWSIAQCLEHLSLATNQFENYFITALEGARGKSAISSAPVYKPSLMGGWLVKYVDPASQKKVPAPKLFRPAAGSSITKSLELFLNAQAKFIDFVRQCNSIDYNKTRLRSPVTPLIRYSLADAFVITILHGERHLGQARRVREMLQFPRA
ncbi:MAG: DinB family protein [Pyrinomonadaceae bacterium]